MGPFRRILFIFPPGRQENKGNTNTWGEKPIYDNRTEKLVKPDFPLAHLHS
jgi:hypothetical protein